MKCFVGLFIDVPDRERAGRSEHVLADDKGQYEPDHQSPEESEHDRSLGLRDGQIELVYDATTIITSANKLNTYPPRGEYC